MKIAAPVSCVEEVEMLVHFGADELYCGVRTPEWEEHFGRHWWMNRRSPMGANLGSWADMEKVANLARGNHIPVHITLNAPFYTQGGIRYLSKLAEKLISQFAINSIIVSDLNFLMHLAREKFPVNLHLSSLGSCMNVYSVDFYQSLGVKRIILPRQLRASEIKRIVTGNNSPIEFEVFAVNDGCFFEEGFCQTTHALDGSFCLTDWQVRVHRHRENQISAEELGQRLEELREYMWYQNNCGSSFQEQGLPNGPCSLCWFGHFRDWGITAVKIVGREASFYRKMTSLQLVRAVMEEVRLGASCERVSYFARSLRGTPVYCEKGFMCYFRDQ